MTVYNKNSGALTRLAVILNPVHILIGSDVTFGSVAACVREGQAKVELRIDVCVTMQGFAPTMSLEADGLR